MRRHVPACGVPLPAQSIRPSRPGRAGRSSLDYSPARQRSWGFKSSSLCPSQVCSRRRAAACVSAAAGPTCPLSSRFHIRSPIDFRRTDPPALARVSSKREFKKGETCGSRMPASMDFWASFPSAVRLRNVACALRCLWATLWRRLADRSCLGLRLFQVCRAPSMWIARGSNRARSSASAKPTLLGCAARRGILRARRDHVKLRYPLLGFGRRPSRGVRRIDALPSK